MTGQEQAAKALAGQIEKLAAGREIKIMHVCGTHEYTITKSGIRSLLPANVKVVMGPGCPVCVTPQSEIDACVELAEQGKIICTYGDLLRVPGTKSSLYDTVGDIRIVQSIAQAVDIARQTPDREVVFMAVGFETTAPTTAAVLLSNPPENFSIIVSHRLVPPAMKWLMQQGEANLNGFLLPGHVCTVMGIHEYEAFPVPQVIAGFDAMEVLYGLYLLVKQIVEGRAVVENAYARAVKPEGNLKAQKMMAEVFEPCDIMWRGFPVIPDSGYKLKPQFEKYDALKKFGIELKDVKCTTGCLCNELLRGVKEPTDCKLFGKACTPLKPVGACMVSTEGACRIWYTYGKAHKIVQTTPTSP
ncbi:hydrogenase formation protein HypD [Methanocella arvoryzae]|uniref:Hydrogenase expression/formation protein (Maturation factor) n=1 Tax=Methanocella arvoryzae (strain DSM 22066 / NBRC 105507 / MRE50) TaxID=351160 RepID=Q0W4N4_METAR|nr:hydrogenase formation protein HypD [Methanocella arvoryzae]CAJ36659.1 hydrogenase expression/formation protein (maturation factor) [Methanocella arvoryzae MRE50]